jgi:iron complex outermembrane receptor protein
MKKWTCHFGLTALAAFAAAAVSASAFAAPQAAEGPAAPAAPAPVLEEIVVTGSRIAAPNMTSTSPIQVVTAKEIQLGGKLDVIDLINQLPQNFQNSNVDFSNTSNGLTTPGGLTTADLRGLGPQRTLVLVNGRRLGTADANTANPNPAPDLDQIPVALIERVEVVTGGASAVYGSDAIAGVVNFIMKKNFQGFQIDTQLGENWHSNHNRFTENAETAAGFPSVTGTAHDGRTRSINITAGTNVADDKGNVTVFFGYLNADPVVGSARDFGACQLNPVGLTGAHCSGSANSNFFTSPLDNNNYTVVGNQFLPWPQANSNPPAHFNSQKYIYMSRGDQRYTAGFMGHVDVNEAVRPYVELNFMNDKTSISIAPSGLFQSNPLDTNGNFNINCSNPFLSAQEASVICTPAQIATDRANPGSASANVNIGRRNVEGGGRNAFWEHTNYRAVAGVKGDFASAWNYDAYGQYYYTSLFNSNSNFLNFASITNALQVRGTAANPVCISGPPCVPWNIFQDGGVTQGALNYLYTRGTAYGTVTQRIIHADVTGDLGKYGIRSPLATEGLGLNIGAEHRAEQLSFAPDSGETSGLLSGFGGASVAIDNGYSVKEGFIELRAPLVQDKPGVKDLLFDTGYRRSDYTTAGSVNTYKFELQYAPVRDLRFRGGYQRAIRAPNIIEAFVPPSFGGISPPGVDPCAPTFNAANVLVPATASLARCMLSGVTAAEYGNGGTTNTIHQCVAFQCSQVQGGNPHLKAEQADSYTFGLTLTPSFLPSFTGSIDYYDIKLKDSVGTIPATFILQDCLINGNPTYCNQIVRTSAGSISGSSLATAGYINQSSVNIGAAKVEGIDLQGNYKLALGPRWGSLGFAFNGAYLLSTTTTPLPAAHTYDFVGLYGTTCQTINPRWRHNVRMSWDMPWNVVVSTYWRYIGSVKLDSNTSDPTLTNGAFNAFAARMPSESYLDLSAAWQIRPDIELRLGINNILDKDPPIVTQNIVPSGLPNAYPTYDTLGRQLFMALTAKF